MTDFGRVPFSHAAQRLAAKKRERRIPVKYRRKSADRYVGRPNECYYCQSSFITVSSTVTCQDEVWVRGRSGVDYCYLLTSLIEYTKVKLIWNALDRMMVT